MVRYTTPTLSLQLPPSVDLTLASDVYVTFAKVNGGTILTKNADALEISEHQVDVFLDQAETGMFSMGTLQVQLNWTYKDGTTLKRACSDIATINVSPNLLDEVLQE